MNFEGVNFNEIFWKGKKEEDFLEHEKHHGLTKKQLKEAFELMQAEPKKDSEETNPESPAKDQPVDTGKATKKA